MQHLPSSPKEESHVGGGEDTSHRNWVATEVFDFWQDLSPHQSQATLGVHVCPPPLPGTAACSRA